jgi:ribosomal protein S18 acetylase RimI-like enzyme
MSDLIQPLPPSRYTEAIDLLALSFEPDPLLPYLTRLQGDAHRQLVRRILRLEFDFHLCGGAEALSIVRDGRLLAVSLIEPPACQPNYLRVAPAVIRFLAQARPACVWRMVRYSAAISANRPTWPHYRLEALAVHPSARGQGFGRHLTDHLRERCLADPRAEGIAFMTANADNISLYRHLNYDLINPHVVFDGLPLYYFQWRKP